MLDTDWTFEVLDFFLTSERNKLEAYVSAQYAEISQIHEHTFTADVSSSFSLPLLGGHITRPQQTPCSGHDQHDIGALPHSKGMRISKSKGVASLPYVKLTHVTLQVSESSPRVSITLGSRRSSPKRCEKDSAQPNYPGMINTWWESACLPRGT